MYLFIDTETTGTPKNYNASYTEVDNWPRITQLAWKLYNKDFKLVKSFNSLIIPDGWKIPSEEELIQQGAKNPRFFIENNMSTERCLNEGRELKGVLINLIKEINDANFLIAHNIGFDAPVLACEIYRLGLEVKNKPVKICTMKTTTDILQLPGQFGFKYPTLTELHRYLFNEDFSGAHDAQNDVEICAKCFFELLKKNYIKLE
jgi:DNA polymerase III epsilon subunit-like protein